MFENYIEKFLGQKILHHLVKIGYEFRFDENNYLKSFSSSGVETFRTEREFQLWLDKKVEIYGLNSSN